jgi:hypothetical protein
MYRFRSQQNAQPNAAHATSSDFCEKLREDLQPLYLLAFLLIGNHAQAEKCFLATVGDAVGATGVFKGWERSWMKRCLIINAIRLVFAGTAERREQPDPWHDIDSDCGACCPINSLTRLTPPFLRFVFVMTVLERYSDHECALLLGRTPRGVAEARTRALCQFSGVGPAFAKLA